MRSPRQVFLSFPFVLSLLLSYIRYPDFIRDEKTKLVVMLCVASVHNLYIDHSVPDESVLPHPSVGGEMQYFFIKVKWWNVLCTFEPNRHTVTRIHRKTRKIAQGVNPCRIALCRRSDGCIQLSVSSVMRDSAAIAITVHPNCDCCPFVELLSASSEMTLRGGCLLLSTFGSGTASKP